MTEETEITEVPPLGTPPELVPSTEPVAAYEVIGVESGSASVRYYSVENSELESIKTVNVSDLNGDEDLMVERFEQHLLSFIHRLSIGIIQPKPEDIALPVEAKVIPEKTTSAKSKKK